MKKSLSLFFVLGLSILILTNACKTSPKDTDTTLNEIETETSNTVRAIPMPSTLASGNPFPTPESMIQEWISESRVDNDNLETNPDIIKHGWDIWAALVELTDQSYDGNNRLRRFETWYDDTELKNATTSGTSLSKIKRTPSTPAMPRQISIHAPEIARDGFSATSFNKFDPSMAEYIVGNNLLKSSVLNDSLQVQSSKPEPGVVTLHLPTSSVSLKPVFSGNTIPTGATSTRIPYWTGPSPVGPKGGVKMTDTLTVTTQQADVNHDNKVYYIDDFVHILDSNGNISILTAMHVTTRETFRWTWQTFWWSISPTSPQVPSSEGIASLRPDVVLNDVAAGHYAMAVAYNMVVPAQPIVGGTGQRKTSIYAYNPYLEAPFTHSVFSYQTTLARYSYVNPNNDSGIHTNCMSCHGQAAVPNGPGYIADQYVSRDYDGPFNGNLLTDFSWAIVQLQIKDE